MRRFIDSLWSRLFFTWRYFGKSRWDTGIPAPELVRALDGKSPGRALDLGCGTGTNVLYMAEHGWQAVGVDFVLRAIQKGRARAEEAGLAAQFMAGDVTKLQKFSFADKFDLALDMGCFHSLTGEDDYLAYGRGLRYWLKDGAIFLLYVHLIEPQEIEYSTHGVTESMVENTFRRGFRLNDIEPGEDGNRRAAWYYFQANPGQGNLPRSS